MLLFDFFIYLFGFWLVFKVLRFFFRYMSQPEPKKNGSNYSKPQDSKLQIKKEDIIDAEFEEIKSEKKNN